MDLSLVLIMIKHINTPKTKVNIVTERKFAKLNLLSIAIKKCANQWLTEKNALERITAFFCDVTDLKALKLHPLNTSSWQSPKLSHKTMS